MPHPIYIFFKHWNFFKHCNFQLHFSLLHFTYQYKIIFLLTFSFPVFLVQHQAQGAIGLMLHPPPREICHYHPCHHHNHWFWMRTQALEVTSPSTQSHRCYQPQTLVVLGWCCRPLQWCPRRWVFNTSQALLLHISHLYSFVSCFLCCSLTD